MTYIVIVHYNAFSFQFFASIVSIMGYLVLWKCKDLGLFLLRYLPSNRIFSGIFHLIRQIVSLERKQLLFNYLGVLGACELGHDLQTREGIKSYPSLCIFLVPGNVGHNLQTWKALKTYPFSHTEHNVNRL
jgi:hypothetical protein